MPDPQTAPMQGSASVHPVDSQTTGSPGDLQTPGFALDATSLLVVSDLHLDPRHPRTYQALLQCLTTLGPQAGAIAILGDLFESWIGDDILDDASSAGFLAPLITTLNTLSRQKPVVFVHGNRDFLLGPRFADACGMRLLPDPTPARIAGHALLLAHGDALCTDDHAYQAFRQHVRNPVWQAQILALPIPQRLELARQMRDGSERDKQQKAAGIMDVNAGAVQALRQEHAEAGHVLVHGHTHRPALHTELDTSARWVSPDWDLDDAMAPRAGYLWLDASGAQWCDWPTQRLIAQARWP